jgi:predicted TIM-barrel fold metal-dependent hydrolase
VRAVAPFPIVDADSHFYEPAAIWTDYLSAEERALARVAFWHEEDAEGNRVTVLNGKAARPLNPSRLNRLALWRPGLTPEAIGALDPRQAQPLVAGARDPAARLADMDTMGIGQAVIFPTLFAEYLPAVENPEAAAALARAYNNWAADFAAAAPERLFPAAILPLQSLYHALHELERAAARGFKATFIRPAFYEDRYLNHPDFNSLWDRLQALDLAACVHPSPGFTNPEGISSGAFIERVAQRLRPGHPVAPAVAGWHDNATLLTALAFYGHLEEYPELKLAFCHAGAAWLPLTLEKAETYLWLALQLAIPVSLEPGKVFAGGRPSLVTFDAWESAVARMPDVFAATAAWGSRYPHHDAAGPDEAIALQERHGVASEIAAALLGGNATRFFGLPSAAEIG